MNQIKIIRHGHLLLERSVEGLTREQLLEIPAGFRNNILWNLGHAIVTQQSLQYRLAGQPMLIPDELVEQCRAGSSPAEWSSPPDIEALREYLRVLPDRLEEDFAAGKLANHQGFTAKSTGTQLSTAEEVMDFVIFHHGLHLGVIQAMRKVVA